MQKSVKAQQQQIPDTVLESMASAMLEPSLNKTASTVGNIVRKKVLQRALNAASEQGWLLAQHTVASSANPENDCLKP